MTYIELAASAHTWIARHVACDLLAMHSPLDVVSDHDLKKVEDAKVRDAAAQTFPHESRRLA